MNEAEEISTEEILTSIRNILLEKKENFSKEDVLELTKDMIYKKSYKVDYNRVADEILESFSVVLTPPQKKEDDRVSVKADL